MEGSGARWGGGVIELKGKTKRKTHSDNGGVTARGRAGVGIGGHGGINGDRR